MQELSFDEVCKAIRGRPVSKGFPALPIKRISTDSRTLKSGDLFIALKGEKYDGHDFVREAVKKGASGVVVTRPVCPLPEGRAVIKVRDTLWALQELALYYRRKFSPLVIGITGSNGKTTTKELIREVLSLRYKVLASPGNYNNLIGVPLTLFSLSSRVDVLVLEMATNHPGEIKRLAEIAAPIKVGVFTNIGATHLEFFGSRENVLMAKMELLTGIPREGIIILNNDDIYLRRCKNVIQYECEVITYGLGRESRIKSTRPFLCSKGMRFRVETEKKSHVFFLRSIGGCNMYNALAAIALGNYMGISLGKMAGVMKRFRFPKMHLEISHKDGYTVINDSYNANPDSVKEAIEALFNLSGRRKIVVFGDMLELGENSRYLHQEIGELIARKKTDFLFTYGEEARWTAERASRKGMKGRVFAFQNKIDLINRLKEVLQRGDTLLIKGSRKTKMEEVIKKL